jgi:hypothetical protein
MSGSLSKTTVLIIPGATTQTLCGRTCAYESHCCSKIYCLRPFNSKTSVLNCVRCPSGRMMTAKLKRLPLPYRFVRNWSAIIGAKRVSQSRTVSCVRAKPLSKNSSATSRRLNLYRSRHKTASRTISVGTSRELKGVSARSLKVDWH